MHSSVELVSLDDIDRAADLLAAYALSLSPDSKLTP
jgi:putative aminopeptidase FrvX